MDYALIMQLGGRRSPRAGALGRRLTTSVALSGHNPPNLVQYCLNLPSHVLLEHCPHCPALHEHCPSPVIKNTVQSATKNIPLFYRPPTLCTHMSPVHPYLILLSRLCFLFYVLVLCSLCSVPRFDPVPCFMLCSVQFCFSSSLRVLLSPVSTFVISVPSFCLPCIYTALMSEFSV